jgi:hypothetical protein
MKYRKKPVIIEAFQYQKGVNLLNCPEWAKDCFTQPVEKDCDQIVIATLEGDMRANPGDWIIKGVKGELYPCKDDIFRATYDEVTE